MIPRFTGIRQEELTRSHVHTGGSAHMGACQPILTIREEPQYSNENPHPLRRATALPCANLLPVRPRAGGSLRSTTGPDKRAAREGRARASATSGSPVGTRTYLSNVNVPFSQPSGDRVQKVGRKVRSRDEGTLTLGPAARSARPAPRRNQSSRRGLRLLRTGIVRRACWSPMRWRRRWFAVARLRTATGPKFGQ